MKFYPKLDTELSKKTYPFPVSFRHEPKMVRSYLKYQGGDSNKEKFD